MGEDHLKSKVDAASKRKSLKQLASYEPSNSTIYVGSVKVRVMGGAHFRLKKAKDSAPSPYIFLMFGKQQYRTRSIENASEPQWDETAEFELTNKVSDLDVFAYSLSSDSNTPDEFIGMVSIPIGVLVDVVEASQWFQLSDVPLQRKRRRSSLFAKIGKKKSDKKQKAYRGEVHLAIDVNAVDLAEMTPAQLGLKMFGTPLSQLCGKGKQCIPIVVRKCIEYLSQHMDVQGLFRESGSRDEVHQIMRLFEGSDMGESVVLAESTNDPHAVSSLLKVFLGSLPAPLLTHALYRPLLDTFVECRSDREQRIAKFKAMFGVLPPENKALVVYLCSFLHRLGARAETTLMTTQNLAVTLAPNFLSPPAEQQESHEAVIRDTASTVKVVACIIDDIHELFDNVDELLQQLDEMHLSGSAKAEDAGADDAADAADGAAPGRGSNPSSPRVFVTPAEGEETANASPAGSPGGGTGAANGGKAPKSPRAARSPSSKSKSKNGEKRAAGAPAPGKTAGERTAAKVPAGKAKGSETKKAPAPARKPVSAGKAAPKNASAKKPVRAAAKR